MNHRKTIELRMFECSYHPTSRAGVPIPNETGNLPSVTIAARTQAEAEKLAAARVGFPIVETTRLDGIKPPKAARVKRKPKRSPAELGLVTAASLLTKESTR